MAGPGQLSDDDKHSYDKPQETVASLCALKGVE